MTMGASGRGPKIGVLLLDTNPPWMNGSMQRYAELVERALLAMDGKVLVSRLSLAIPINPSWVSQRILTWLNHLWLALFAGRRIRKAHKAQAEKGANLLLHLLDGSYGYVLNGTKGIPSVATVHDLIPLLEYCAARKQVVPSQGQSTVATTSLRALNVCTHLVADSTNTAQDYFRFTQTKQDKITCVPIAIDPVFNFSDQQRSVVQALPSVQPYILHVGNDAWYKNRDGVLRIFARIVASRPDLELVLVGPPLCGNLRDLAESLGVHQRIRQVNGSSSKALVEIYGSAELLLFPSRYEGFGWPPLEAMACGCPVVCSSEGSLPEVVGNAGLMARASDEEQLAAHCLAILEDQDKAKSMIAQGLERASQFTLERMGRQLLEVYSQALQ
jgi:glycosyltransferase involved in cell wall biosynthesis